MIDFEVDANDEQSRLRRVRQFGKFLQPGFKPALSSEDCSECEGRANAERHTNTSSTPTSNGTIKDRLEAGMAGLIELQMLRDRHHLEMNEIKKLHRWNDSSSEAIDKIKTCQVALKNSERCTTVCEPGRDTKETELPSQQFPSSDLSSSYYSEHLTQRSVSDNYTVCQPVSRDHQHAGSLSMTNDYMRPAVFSRLSFNFPSPLHAVLAQYCCLGVTSLSLDLHVEEESILTSSADAAVNKCDSYPEEIGRTISPPDYTVSSTSGCYMTSGLSTMSDDEITVESILSLKEHYNIKLAQHPTYQKVTVPNHLCMASSTVDCSASKKWEKFCNNAASDEKLDVKHNEHEPRADIIMVIENDRVEECFVSEQNEDELITEFRGEVTSRTELVPSHCQHNSTSSSLAEDGYFSSCDSIPSRLLPTTHGTPKPHRESISSEISSTSTGIGTSSSGSDDDGTLTDSSDDDADSMTSLSSRWKGFDRQRSLVIVRKGRLQHGFRRQIGGKFFNNATVDFSELSSLPEMPV